MLERDLKGKGNDPQNGGLDSLGPALRQRDVARREFGSHVSLRQSLLLVVAREPPEACSWGSLLEHGAYQSYPSRQKGTVELQIEKGSELDIADILQQCAEGRPVYLLLEIANGSSNMEVKKVRVGSWVLPCK